MLYVLRTVVVLGLRCNAVGASGAEWATDETELGDQIDSLDETELTDQIDSLFAQPVSFSMGPFADVGGEDPINLFDPSPLDFLGLTSDLSSQSGHWMRGGRFFDRPQNDHPRDVYKNRFQHLVKRHMSSPAHPKAFKVRRIGNTLHLQLSIPRSKFRKPEGDKKGYEEGHIDQPLIVAVIGRSLVIQVRRASEQAIKSSQRSFKLPESADVKGIEAVFDATGGTLSVDVPLMHLDHKPEHLELLEDGSQTTITFAHGGYARDDNMQLPSTLMSFLPGHEGGVELLGQTAGSVGLRQSMHGNKRKPSVLVQRPRCGRKSSAKLNHRVPIAVQPKNAKPFWRLVVGDGPRAHPAIEIVAPRGIDLGQPKEGQMPIYNGTDSELRGSRMPIGEMTLPVQVSDSDCSWTADPMPVWMVGLVASLTAGATILLAVAVRVGPANFNKSGLKATRKPCALVQFSIALLTCFILLGAALSVYVAYQQSHKFDERSLRCSFDHDSMKKINVRVAGEL